MRGERCLFAREAPEIEIRGGMVFIQPLDGHSEIAVSPHTLALFVHRAQQVLAAIKSADVVEFPRASGH
jgi:hypothetical protein